MFFIPFFFTQEEGEEFAYKKMAVTGLATTLAINGTARLAHDLHFNKADAAFLFLIGLSAAMRASIFVHIL